MKTDEALETLQIGSDLSGKKLDKGVMRLCNCSRRVARLLVGSGWVRLNGRIAKIVSKELKEGQILSVPRGSLERLKEDGESSDSKSQYQNMPGEILHLDRQIVVISKPSGLLSEQDRFGAPSADHLVGAYLKKRGESSQVWLVHRLDAVTSGVLMFARTKQAAKRLYAAFREREVKKEYLALVRGGFAGSVTVNEPIGRIRGTQHGVKTDGKPAKTMVRLVDGNVEGSLLSVAPHTGRTHQIRVHLSHLKYPILGDKLYGGPMYVHLRGDGGGRMPLTRTMLHAYRLSLKHPKTNEDMEFQAPPPPDFQSLMESLAVGLSVHQD